LCLERDYITTFVLATGDSDFTPLVHKLRELNRRVIGLGVEAATSALLPAACDEFLFYERLEGIEFPNQSRVRSGTTARRRRAAPEPTRISDATVEPVGNGVADDGGGDEEQARRTPDDADLGVLITQTLSGLERTSGGPVLASNLKRTILRKDPTFSETDHGFRGFVELLRHLADRGVVEVGPGRNGDPEVSFPSDTGDQEAAFELLRSVVEKLTDRSGPPHLSGLKDQLRRVVPDFSEKRFGYGGFLQFAKAARARGIVDMKWDDDTDDYVLTPRSA
jgi:hypothetical protein